MRLECYFNELFDMICVIPNFLQEIVPTINKLIHACAYAMAVFAVNELRKNSSCTA